MNTRTGYLAEEKFIGIGGGERVLARATWVTDGWRAEIFLFSCISVDYDEKDWTCTHSHDTAAAALSCADAHEGK